MTLDSLVRKLQSHLEKGSFENEQTVREALVVPILQALGWDTVDPEMVVREYSIENRRVDYALAPRNQRVEAIIEVKAPGQLIQADRQLFEYSFHEGAPFAILTDGNEWHFFLPGEPGAYWDRRVYKLDLRERDAEEVADTLKRYLDYQRFESGQALDAARQDYYDKARREKAKAALPRAWVEIVQNRDEILLDLLAEKAESLSGVRPENEQVESFVASYLDTVEMSTDGVSSGYFEKVSFKARESFYSDRANVRSASKESSWNSDNSSTNVQQRSKKIRYELCGKEFYASNAKYALLEILRQLAKQDPEFYEKLSPRVRTRKRNHIARRKEDVYPERPDLADYATEITNGWWVGLNIANREKERILKEACAVVGWQYGVDLKIDLPNK